MPTGELVALFIHFGNFKLFYDIWLDINILGPDFIYYKVAY